MNTDTKIKPKISLRDNPIIQKLKSRKLWTIISYIVPIIFFLASSAITIYYIFWGSQKSFHSDCTDTIMWAAASHESGEMINKDFSYACFLPFGISLIMQPLISVFGVSLTTHHLGMLAFFLLFIGFFILMLREMHIDIRYNLTAASVLLGITLSSVKTREMFWEHTIYYSLGILFIFIGTFLYFKLSNLHDKRIAAADEKSKKKLGIYYCIVLAVLCIFIMFTATDGISALSIFGLPFLAAIFAERFFDIKSKFKERTTLFTYIRIILFAVMIFLGTRLAAIWEEGSFAGYEAAFSNFSAFDTWVDNAFKLPTSWLTVLGIENTDGTMLSSPEGIVNLLRILISVIIAIIPVLATCFYNKYPKNTKGKMLRTLIWIHWAATAIITVGFIFGSLSSAPWRLVPILGTSVIVSIVFIAWALSEKGIIKRFSILFTVPVIIVSVLNFKAVAQIPADSYTENRLFTITDILEENNLTYGYTTFWNANAITVISGEKVKARDVHVDENGITENAYQSSSKWYEAQEGQEEYFLLLNSAEYDSAVNYAYDVISSAKRDIKFNTHGIDYHIFVFDHNIL